MAAAVAMVVREHEDAGPRHAPGAARASIIGEEEEGLASDRGVGQQPAPAIAQQPGEARRASVAVVRLRVVDQEDQIRAVRALDGLQLRAHSREKERGRLPVDRRAPVASAA